MSSSFRYLPSVRYFLWLFYVAVAGLISSSNDHYFADAASSTLVMSKEILHISKAAGELSALCNSMKDLPANDPLDGIDGDGELLYFFNSEPDQALVAKKMGYCFAVFRGTTKRWDDWMQNIEPGYRQICNHLNDETSCCSVRAGFYNAYDAPYRDDLEESIRLCAADSPNGLILTGHSQGGAIASVAALSLADLNPIIITFGAPPAINTPCPLIQSERWYRYINSMVSSNGIVYDMVPFLPAFVPFFGYMIILSEDSTGVANIGLDSQEFFSADNLLGFKIHRMRCIGADYPGYVDRLESIIAEYDGGNDALAYPVRTNGYPAGNCCSKDIECESRNCQTDSSTVSRCADMMCGEDSDCGGWGNQCIAGMCLPKLDSCMKCKKHSDCLSNHCNWANRCSSVEDGLSDNDCACAFGSECRSGRCDGIFVLSRVCKSKLPTNAWCNEDNDCLSGECSWLFRCR